MFGEFNYGKVLSLVIMSNFHQYIDVHYTVALVRWSRAVLWELVTSIDRNESRVMGDHEMVYARRRAVARIDL